MTGLLWCGTWGRTTSLEDTTDRTGLVEGHVGRAESMEDIGRTNLMEDLNRWKVS